MACPLCPHCRAEQARTDALKNLADAVAWLRDTRESPKMDVFVREPDEAVYEQVGDFTIPRRQRPWDRPDYGRNGKLTGVIDFLDGNQAAEFGEPPRCPPQIINRAEWRKGYRQARAEMAERDEVQREWADKMEVYRRRS